LQVPRSDLPRPNSVLTLGSDGLPRGRTHSPHLSVGGSGSPGGSPVSYGRPLSAARKTPDSRPQSYVDLLNVPYPQQVAPAPSMDNTFLRSAVGNNASLLDTRKTLDMYRANVKKTNDPGIQYEFAIFMVQASRESDTAETRVDLLREARQILQKLADRSYPFAQYYLGDGYASGLFNKGKEDWERAFPLFMAASKHGHAEAGYRAALCYEFGWGCRKDYAKAVQFYRQAAAKNHPGAATRLGRACLTGDMGLGNRTREGMRWLKRAAESADFQYNSAPYELGVLHEHGYGDDIFKDEAYAAQLYTQSADLGHPEACLRMGQAYEHGQLSCPKDPALSVHFYNGAAQAGIPEAMMALCAWYFVGAIPVLEKDENEAYEWAKRAADCAGYAKAQYAVGYFTEMGIGCRRDPLEANVWYVRAADQGDEKAKQRLAIIRDAAAG
ncbi:HCP-like protein, partial [Rhizodiscina lignyota]